MLRISMGEGDPKKVLEHSGTGIFQLAYNNVCVCVCAKCFFIPNKIEKWTIIWNFKWNSLLYSKATIYAMITYWTNVIWINFYEVAPY